MTLQFTRRNSFNRPLPPQKRKLFEPTTVTPINSLAYGWSAGNLNRPLRIQQSGKILVSWCKVDKSGKALKSGTFRTGDGVRHPRKGIFNFKNHTSWQKLKSMNHFVCLNFYCVSKLLSAWQLAHNSSSIARYDNNCALLNKICCSFIFVSCEEKGCYRVVSLGHQNFDCRSHCGLSRRMQGGKPPCYVCCSFTLNCQTCYTCCHSCHTRAVMQRNTFFNGKFPMLNWIFCRSIFQLKDGKMSRLAWTLLS